MLESKDDRPHPGAVVGTVHSVPALAAARKLPRGAVDYLELRLDNFAALPHGERELERLEAAAPHLPAPLIVTARHPREGGFGALTAPGRRRLLRRFLKHAALIDIELRSALQLTVSIREARETGVGVILSHHDFQRTPPLARLIELAQRARGAGATVFKLATTATCASDLTVLLRFLTETKGTGSSVGGLAVMGMGPFGKISRLLLGRAGSVLNYGYLDKSQVPGQWPAVQLKERLAEVAEAGR